VPATGLILVRLTGTDPAASNGSLAAQGWIRSVVQSCNVAVKASAGGAPLPAGVTATGTVSVHGANYVDSMTVNAPAEIVYRLNGRCMTFQSSIIGPDAAACRNRRRGRHRSRRRILD
jgi:hypothetical protein